MRFLRPRRCWPVLALLLFVGVARAADRYEIAFPDLPEYKTLKCDLHMHTVFSDGRVWPTVRVDEAWREGLDAISITDHIEYKPFKQDVSTDLNRSYELAVDPARKANVLLIPGTEITRSTPPGHYNAIFLDDVNPLDTPEFVDAIEAANKQGAFVFWNHHDWKGQEAGQWSDLQTKLHENKWLHGMEVVNGYTYYPRAHQWCLDRNLTMLGNTDVHQPMPIDRTTPAAHRPMTLVFAKERTPEAIKEALFAGRTAVWFEDKLIGRQEWLAPLLAECIRVRPPHLRDKDNNRMTVEVENRSAMDIHLVVGKGRPTVVPAGGVILMTVPHDAPGKPFEREYTVANFLIAPETGLPVTLRFGGEPAAP